MKVAHKILPNKFKVIYAKDNSNPLISLQLYVRIGSAWEIIKEAGFSHFTEHLVFKSTRKYTSNSLMEKITFLGGHMNAYTEYDSTCYYLTVPSRFIGEGVELLCELVRFSNYSERDFQNEKKVIIEELKQFQSDPEEFFVEKIAEDYFKKNNYRFPIIGNLNNLKKAKYQDLKKFYQKYYVPNNCYLIASGDFEEDQLWKIIDHYFSSWEAGDFKRLRSEQDKLPVETGFISFPGKISNDMLAFVLPDLSDSNPNSYPLSIINKIFAVGKNCRLYERLFHREKLVDHIKMHSISGLNDGINIFLIMPKKKADLSKIIKIFIEELQLLYYFGVTEMEIRETKKEMIYFFRYSQEYVESLGTSLGSEELLTGYKNFERYPKIIRSISVRQIKQVIENYFDQKLLQIYHLGKKQLSRDDILNNQPKVRSKYDKKSLNPDYWEVKLENGLKIILQRIVGKPTIGICLTSEVSQLNENFDNLGINILTSGLLLYGNEKRDYNQFLNFCTSNGINFGIAPQTETTSLKMKCFKEMLPVSLELLSEVINSPLFPRDHLENLKSTYMSNLDRIKDYPQYNATKMWQEMTFGKRSNLLNIEGTKTSIRKITRSQIIKWFDTYYNLADMNLTIVGDYNIDLAIQLCEKFFSNKKTKIPHLPQKPIFKKTELKKKITNQNLNQAIINLGGFGPDLNQVQENTTFHVMGQIIGGDTNSILFKELRENQGLAYSVDFEFRSIRDLGYFLVTAIVDRRNQQKTITLIKDILIDINKNGIQKDDLIKTKNFIRGQRLMEEESMLGRAQTLSVLHAIGLGYQYYLERDKRLANVNISSIHELSAKYFNQDNFFIHVLT